MKYTTNSPNFGVLLLSKCSTNIWLHKKCQITLGSTQEQCHPLGLIYGELDWGVISSKAYRCRFDCMGFRGMGLSTNKIAWVQIICTMTFIFIGYRSGLGFYQGHVGGSPCTILTRVVCEGLGRHSRRLKILETTSCQ